MFFTPGINVVFGISDVSDLLFEASAEFTTRKSYTHWFREEQLERLPKIPEILVEDPIRLKHIHFYYGKPNPRIIADLTLNNRQREDFIIVEFPSCLEPWPLSTIMAILKDSENVGNTSIIILPEVDDLKITTTLFTKNLWEIDAFGQLCRIKIKE